MHVYCLFTGLSRYNSRYGFETNDLLEIIKSSKSYTASRQAEDLKCRNSSAIPTAAFEIEKPLLIHYSSYPKSFLRITGSIFYIN